MHPRNVDPSGSLDFTNIKNNRTTIDFKLNPYHGTTETFTCHIYYTSYQTFTFENGYLTTREEPISYSPIVEEYGTGEFVAVPEEGAIMIASYPK